MGKKRIVILDSDSELDTEEPRIKAEKTHVKPFASKRTLPAPPIVEIAIPKELRSSDDSVQADQGHRPSFALSASIVTNNSSRTVPISKTTTGASVVRTDVGIKSGFPEDGALSMLVDSFDLLPLPLHNDSDERLVSNAIGEAERTEKPLAASSMTGNLSGGDGDANPSTLGGDQRPNSARMKATDIETDPLAHKRDNMEVSAKRKRKPSAESNPSMEGKSGVAGEEDRPFKKPRELRDVPKVVVTDAEPALSERHTSKVIAATPRHEGRQPLARPLVNNQTQNSKLDVNKLTFVPDIHLKENYDKCVTKPSANTNRVSAMKRKDGKANVPVAPSTAKVKIGRPASSAPKIDVEATPAKTRRVVGTRHEPEGVTMIPQVSNEVRG
jgi:hypothetical protein